MRAGAKRSTRFVFGLRRWMISIYGGDYSCCFICIVHTLCVLAWITGKQKQVNSEYANEKLHQVQK